MVQKAANGGTRSATPGYMDWTRMSGQSLSRGSKGVVTPQQNLISDITAATERTNAANKKRETEIRSVLDRVIGLYEQGGPFGKGVETQLEQERKSTLSAGGQALISSGLFNTTQTAGLAGKFSEEVAMPTRMKLEDLRMERLSQALGQKASFVESITDQGPDYRLLAELMAQ